MRAPNHTWPEPRPLAGEATQPRGVEEDDDDEAGQDTISVKNRLSDLARAALSKIVPSQYYASMSALVIVLLLFYYSVM